jgi:hypothetical protein
MDDNVHRKGKNIKSIIIEVVMKNIPSVLTLSCPQWMSEPCLHNSQLKKEPKGKKKRRIKKK